MFLLALDEYLHARLKFTSDKIALLVIAYLADCTEVKLNDTTGELAHHGIRFAARDSP
jgi:hypothetical protein